MTSRVLLQAQGLILRASLEEEVLLLLRQGVSFEGEPS